MCLFVAINEGEPLEKCHIFIQVGDANIYVIVVVAVAAAAAAVAVVVASNLGFTTL